MNPMTPWDKLVASGNLKSDDVPEKWDWHAYVPMWVWHTISLADYRFGSTALSWDRIGDTPPFVMFEHSGNDTSRGMAVTWDDEATGLFYYRDWTSSGIPCIADGNTYWSGFWFERLADANAFHDKYGGIASWKSDFESKRRLMNTEREQS